MKNQSQMDAFQKAFSAICRSIGNRIRFRLNSSSCDTHAVAVAQQALGVTWEQIEILCDPTDRDGHPIDHLTLYNAIAFFGHSKKGRDVKMLVGEPPEFWRELTRSVDLRLWVSEPRSLR